MSVRCWWKSLGEGQTYLVLMIELLAELGKEGWRLGQLPRRHDL